MGLKRFWIIIILVNLVKQSHPKDLHNLNLILEVNQVFLDQNQMG